MSGAGILKVPAASVTAGDNVSVSGSPIVTIAALAGVATVNSTYTATSSDFLVNCTSGTFTVTLPSVSDADKMLNIKNSGTGIITVDGAGAETIDGDLTQTLIQDESITVYSDGSTWYII